MPSDATDGPGTRAVHAGSRGHGALAPVVLPIYQTATFFTEMAEGAEVGYTRYGNNPNHTSLGARLAALEGAEDAIAVASGNAAMALLLLEAAATGDRIIAPRQLYGGTLRLLLRDLPRLGIETDFVDFAEDWHEAIGPRTRLVLLEVPVNPTLRVPDLAGIAVVAAAHGVPLAVDATFATPINLRPLEHGATLVMHSATKYLGGHSDVMGGVVAGSAERIAAIRDLMVGFGPVLDPHAAWLLERGVKTLSARMAKHNENGLAVAHSLAAHPGVEAVHYPGLESHPDHDRARTLLDGFGGMVGVVVRGGDDAAVRALERLRLFSSAPSLGGVESLVSMPRFTSHAALSEGERRAVGIEPGFVRLSLGIEDAADLIADLAQALPDD